MPHIRLFHDNTISINVASIARSLNLICRTLKFSAGKSTVVIPDDRIMHPDSYSRLSAELRSETKDDFLAMIVTKKQYTNNFFFGSYGNLVILSFFAWEYLTKLPFSNGLVFFIADFLALEIDNTFRHNVDDGEPKPECIYDFGWNKAGVDIGMRSSLICPDCIQRIDKKKLTRQQAEVYADLKKILNDLGNASKWETDIIKYWKSRKIKNGSHDDTSKVRNQVFISYSHADAEWLQRLKTHLKPFERNYLVHVWDDTQIKTGQDWKLEIEQALERTRIAVLLISADFLASDFIATNELPPLLAAAEQGGAIIMPIILKPCGFTRLANLSRFQAVNPPSKTLVEMSEGERERFLSKLTDDILNDLR